MHTPDPTPKSSSLPPSPAAVFNSGWSRPLTPSARSGWYWLWKKTPGIFSSPPIPTGAAPSHRSSYPPTRPIVSSPLPCAPVIPHTGTNPEIFTSSSMTMPTPSPKKSTLPAAPDSPVFFSPGRKFLPPRNNTDYHDLLKKRAKIPQKSFSLKF